MPGQDWNQSEINAVVDAYFGMLGEQIAGRRIIKANVIRALKSGALSNRSVGSIGLKLSNISAVLRQAELPWVRGFAPRSHFQQALRKRVHDVASERHL